MWAGLPAGKAASRNPLKNLLILGGTSEAADLALALSAVADLRVVTSLAGRTRAPRLLAGEVRTGGFGGVDGLRQFLRDRNINAVIDATHPFAAQMSTHAATACLEETIPRLGLVRPLWPRHDGDYWIEVADAEAAAAALPGVASRVFLSTGHRDLEAFAGLDDLWFLIRTVEPVDGRLPRQAHFIQARGPFEEDAEVALFRNHQVDAVVTKASGGAATYSKIAAARRLGLPVVMIRRPPPPAGPAVVTVQAAVAWLLRQITA